MLRVESLEVVYHSVLLVLKEVSFEVRTGQIVALLGPNGAGKTTALRALSGLLPLHEGRITKGDIQLGGDSIVRRRADEIVRGGVVHVMEGRRIFRDLSVEENLLAGGHVLSRSEARAQLHRFYARFPILADRRHQAAGALSGGEQQMLAIARGLMGRPKLLLLDEPSLGLAPRIVREVAALIREINADGVSVLLVEQNANMALELASYAYVLENGRIVVDGRSEELRQDRDIREFYLGLGGEGRRSYRTVKHYRRRKRWLS